MLSIQITQRKQPPTTYVYKYTPPPVSSFNPTSSTFLTTLTERQAHLDRLVKALPYKVGDICVRPPPTAGSKEIPEKYEILYIAKRYVDLGKDIEWPVNNNPMIITARGLITHTTFNCTTNYLFKEVV